MNQTSDAPGTAPETSLSPCPTEGATMAEAPLAYLLMCSMRLTPKPVGEIRKAEREDSVSTRLSP